MKANMQVKPSSILAKDLASHPVLLFHSFLGNHRPKWPYLPILIGQVIDQVTGSSQVIQQIFLQMIWWS